MRAGFGLTVVAAVAVGAMAAGTAAGQVETIDPNQATTRAAAPAPPPVAPRPTDEPLPPPAAVPPPPSPTDQAATRASEQSTYQQGDVLAAAEGVFGKGAEGLAKAIESVFRKQGRPVGYIVGREAGAAVIAGVRYGSGTLFHKVEGERPVYWQGPSIGFDLGANGAKTFILVYNLYDSQDLYRRYPAVEGSAFVVGGFQGSYLQRGHVILVPIRLGVGLRLGANLGYMHFTEKKHWSPF